MSSEVPEFSLNSLCSLVVDCPHATPKWTDYGYVVLRNQNIKNGRLDLSSPSFTDEAHFKGRIRRAAPQPGDLVITREAPMGDVCQIPDGLVCCLGQRQVLLRPDPEKVDARYLLFALQSPYLKHQIGWNEGTGSTVSNLRIPVLEALKIPCPALEQQQEIAMVLGTIDDRIALLRETNATLEVIAQALFKSWFVDFDPVHARARGEQPAGLAPEVAALFPDSFEESELGMVPKGWKLMQFGEFIARQSVGKKYDQKSALEEGGVPILDQGKSGVIGFHNDKPSVCASLVSPVVVFANHTCYMRLITFDFSAIQNVLPFIGKGVDTVWAFYATKDRVKFSEYKGHWPEFVIQKTIVPHQELTEIFRNMVDPLICSMRNNELQAQTLANLRDTLLPRLISGQLRLPDAEQQLKDLAV